MGEVSLIYQKQNTMFTKSEIEVLKALNGGNRLPQVKKVKLFPKNYARHDKAIEKLKVKNIIYKGKHDDILHIWPAVRTQFIKTGLL